MKVRIVELMIEVNRMYLNEMILELKSLISYLHFFHIIMCSLFIYHYLSMRICHIYFTVLIDF